MKKWIPAAATAAGAYFNCNRSETLRTAGAYAEGVLRASAVCMIIFQTRLKIPCSLPKAVDAAMALSWMCR